MSEPSHGKAESEPFERYLADVGWVLSPRPCSGPRQEFFKRANEIDLFYTIASTFIQEGRKAFDAWAQREDLSPDTPIRITEEDGTKRAAPYRLLRSRSPTLRQQLANQVFLMLYGSFEAYIADVVCDAYSQLGEGDPESRTLQTIYGKRWPGRLDSMHQDLQVQLPKRRFTSAFKGQTLVFLGKKRDDPRDFLEDLAQVRHLLVHSAGRVSAAFLADYPEAAISAGDLINIPYATLRHIELFLFRMTDVLDAAFAEKFGWARPVKDPAKLLFTDP